MATRQTTLLLKRSNVIGKIPPLSGLTLGEMALNTADAKLYTLFTSGTTGATEVREIGWNRVSKTGDTISGDLIINGGLSATTISATTYQNLPVSGLTGSNNINITNSNGNFTITLSGSAGGDLSGTYPNPIVDGLQGNAVSNVAPLTGQTLQWNGSAWTPGAIPNGGSGGGGVVYYFNYQNTTNISPTTGLPTSPVPPSQLGISYSVGSGSITSANLIDGSYSLICGFVTIVGTPGVTEIPAGLWDFNIWAAVAGGTGQANQTQFQIRVYKYNSSGGTYTSLANSDDIYIYDPSVIAQYIGNVTMPQTTILDTDRIYVELWAQKNVNQLRQVEFYFDSAHPSHVHTTLPSVAGSGVVKVINGVFQSPASTIVNVDVSPTAAIEVSKLSMSTNRILGRTTAGSGSVEEISLTVTGSSGSATLSATNLNIPTYTISGLGGVPTTRSINTTSPLSGGGDLSANRTLSISDALANGTTKGAATFTASDFNDNGSGVISIDYTNGQSASGSNKGFLTSTDWTTFNNKVSTGPITGSGLTMETSRLLGRTTPLSGAVEEISIGTGLSLSGGTLSTTGSTGLIVGTTAIASGATNRILFQSGTTLQQSSNFLYNNTDNRLTLSYSGTSVTPFKVFRDVSGVEETHLELVTTASALADLRIGKTNNVPSGNATSVGTSRITFLTINNSASIGHYSRGNANIWLKQSLTIFQSGFADGNNNSAAKLNMICAQEANTNRVGNGFHWYFSNDVSDTSPTDAQRAMWLTRGYTLQLYNGTGSDSGTVKPNSFEIYSADRGGVDGRAAAHFKSEDGTINVIGDLSGFGTSSPGARVDVMATGTTTGETIFRVTNSGATNVLFSIQGNGKMNLLWSGDTDSTIINGTRSGAAATAVGVSTNSGLRSVAVGYSVDVSGIDGVAVGYNINVTNAGASGIAFGTTITGGSQNGISFGRSIGRNRVGIAIGRNLQFAGDGNNTHFIGYGMTDSSVFTEAKVNDTFGFGSYGLTTGNLPGLTFRSNNLNQLLLGYYSTEANYSTTGGTNWIGIKTGATPSGAINAFQLYSAAVTPGNAAPHFRTENGSTIRLYQNSAVTTTQGVADALTNLGVLSASTIVPTVQSVVSATTVTPAFTNDLVTITAQAGALTLAAPTGTTINGKDLMIRIKDNGTARAITWTSGSGGYRAIGVTLPTTTVANKTTYVGLIYNSDDSRWDAIGVTTEA